MSLRIHDIAFENFRNYERFDLPDVGELTILIGQNGVGKTNVLEGIHLLTSAHSFRNPHIEQLICAGGSLARIYMNAGDGNRSLETALSLQPGKKRYTINGKPKVAADVRGLLPAVAFTPDDLDIAKRTSSVKRRALDDVGIQLTRNYHIVSRDYEKTLRYKNRLLKEEAPSPLVDAINETLVTCGSQLMCYRHALFNRMVPLINAGYGEISRNGEQFSATYLPSWEHLEGEEPRAERALSDSQGEALVRDEVRELLQAALDRHAGEERALRRSLVGPHNDKLAFFLGGADASQYASQGQQRSIVLAWKLAEVQMVKNTLGTAPVLLLDDVMSELDGSRRDMLVQQVRSETQTFITATDLSPFNDELLEKARVVELK